MHKIPSRVLRQAEDAKFIHYCPEGIAFLGRVEYQPLAEAAWVHPIPDAPYRVMPNSDETVPPVLMGDPQRVILCSDGVTALRALAEAKEPPPTVLVLYGPRPENVLLTLPPGLRDLVSNAESVTGFGVVTTRAVFEQVERMQELYGRQHQPDPSHLGEEYDPRIGTRK